MSLELSLMKILLKKKVCGSCEQCTGPTDRRKHTTQASVENAIQTPPKCT